MTLVSERGTSNSTESLNHFFKLAVRQLWRSPGYSCTVLFTQALAIGANAAIFSVVNALLLGDLPYAHAERIGVIYARNAGSESGDGKRNIDGEQWELLRDRRRAQSRMCPKRPTELSASSLASWTTFYSVRSATIGSVAEALRAGR